MSNCSRHPSKEATGACVNCGKLTCPICDVEVDGKTYCQPCAEKLFTIRAADPGAVPSHPPQDGVTAVRGPETRPASTQKAITKPAKTEPAKTGSAPAGSGGKTAATTAVAAVAAKSTEVHTAGKVGWAWWVPPVILGWIGGLISWLPNKDIEPKTALNMLFAGIGVSVLQGAVALIIVLSLVIPAAVRQGTTATTDTRDKKHNQAQVRRHPEHRHNPQIQKQ